MLILTAVLFLFLGCGRPAEQANIEPPISDEPARVSVTTDKHYSPRLPTKVIEVGGYRLIVEVADEDTERRRGLMFRSYVPDSVGMLFVFEEERPHSFWMKNTAIPLAIAFIAADSTITDIKWMKPHDETSHHPSKPILYAIEANQGWFMKHGIKPGVKVKL